MFSPVRLLNGHEQYEEFEVRRKTYVQYDYRHTNGELFSCVKPNLEDCRAARDKWLEVAR